MTTNIPFVLLILLVHFLADFGLQTHEQAVHKSSSNKQLVYHTLVYSLVWLVASHSLLGSIGEAFLFAIITFIAHTITDYITSRVGKPYWEKGDYHNGFVVVGFDQILHYIQLFLTFKLFV